MFITYDGFRDVYQTIKLEALKVCGRLTRSVKRQAELTVLLCVAPDVDALAAAQMIMVGVQPWECNRIYRNGMFYSFSFALVLTLNSKEMFRVDGIKFTLRPVLNYDDFDKARDFMKEPTNKVSFSMSVSPSVSVCPHDQRRRQY